MLAREFRADYFSKSERTAALDIAAKSLVAKARPMRGVPFRFRR